MYVEIEYGYHHSTCALVTWPILKSRSSIGSSSIGTTRNAKSGDARTAVNGKLEEKLACPKGQNQKGTQMSRPLWKKRTREPSTPSTRQ